MAPVYLSVVDKTGGREKRLEGHYVMNDDFCMMIEKTDKNIILV